jgi:hypothetical protein
MKISRLIAVVAAAAVAVAMAPAPAEAAAAIYQTSNATCRASLAQPGSVLIIGDSITAGWYQAVTAQLTAARRPVCVNAQAGRQTAGAVSILAGYKAAGMISAHTTVVMAIGSNDTYGAKSGYMRWMVDNTERVVGMSQPLVWVDVLNWSLSRGAAGQKIYGNGTWTVNLQLWAKDTQYKNLTVAHWNSMIRNNYRAYLLDLLHTNSFGNTARDALIERTLAPLPKPVPTPTQTPTAKATATSTPTP